MSEITHEGKIYILKSQVENIVKERVSRVASKAKEAENRANQLETSLSDIQDRAASIDILSAQIEEYKTKLNVSETRFNRYQAVSRYGITEPEIIEAIEYSYEKSMKGKSDGEKVSLDQWISNHLQTPEKAPILLRPHLIGVVKGKQPEQPTDSKEEQDIQQPEQQQVSENRPVYTSHNKSVVKPPENQNIIQRGIKDSDFYRQNREAIKNAWLAKNKRR